MKHTLFTFTLHRRGVVLLALGALLASGLLVVGGCLVGEWRARRVAGAAAEAELGGSAPGGVTGGVAGGIAAGAVGRGASSAAARVPGASRAAGAARTVGTATTAAGAADAGEVSGGEAGGIPPGPSGMPERFTLRLGAFPTEEEAKALADRLTARGYSATLSQAHDRNGTTLHLVLVGSYGTLWEARGAAAELERREARERWEAVVVPAPQP